MEEAHVILRNRSQATRGLRGGDSFRANPLDRAPAGIAIELDTIAPDKVSSVRRDPEVVAVAPVVPMRLIQPKEVPGAEVMAAGRNWGLHAIGADISPFTGDGVCVAVLDTGIDPEHPAFAGVSLERANFTHDPRDTDALGRDLHGHGTHCAATIFGRDVDGVRVGVARGVTRALIGKVLGEGGGGSGQIASAIQWAVSRGANVISMSLGIDFPGLQKRFVEGGLPPELATSRALEGYRANILLFERLAGMIRASGAFTQAAILVAAAGNESRADENPLFKIAVSPPAVSEGIVSVAALGTSPAGLVVAPFSNTGAMVAAPGVAIHSARLGGGLTAMSGTSMAAPHVAGVAALWAQKLREAGQLTGALLSTRVLGSSTTIGLKPGFDPADVGAGMVRAPQD